MNLSKLLQLCGLSKEFIIALLSIYATLLFGYKLSGITVSWFLTCFMGSIYAKINAIKKIIEKEIGEEYIAYIISFPLAFFFSSITGILLGLYFGTFSLHTILKSFIASTILSIVTYFIVLIVNYLRTNAGNLEFLVYPIIILFISTILIMIDIWLS